MTSRVTTAPAPTVANSPTSVPATTTAPAPIESRPEADGAHGPVVGAGELAGRGDRPRVPIIGQDRARADEDAVLDGHAVVDEGAVLDLDPVADLDALIDEGVPADDASRPIARPT